MDDRTRPRPSKDAVRSDVPHAPWASRVRTLESDARRQAVLDRRRRREMGTDEAAPLCEGGRLAKRLMRGDIPPFVDQPEALGHFVRPPQLGRAPLRERVCQYALISVVAVSLQQKNNMIYTATRQ